MNLPFSLPAPAGYSETPKWDGQNFVFGGHSTPVLEYSENFAGWSDDLTALHEQAAGDNHPVDLASRKDAIAQVRRSFLKPVSSSVIMEIGCSSGFLIKDLIKCFPDATVVGADVVKEPLNRLARDLPGVPLIRFDLLKCPLPDQSVDVLVMLNVLEHIEDDATALKNALKLLKPGGTLVIEVPAGPYLYDGYDAELHHFRRYSATELKHKLSGAGFITTRQSHLGIILYPAFVAVKLLNKWFRSKKNTTVVRDQATRTSDSPLVRWAMSLESNYLANIHLPFGIRALAVARRPE
jgi:SAM-dependent methyltransferase